MTHTDDVSSVHQFCTCEVASIRTRGRDGNLLALASIFFVARYMKGAHATVPTRVGTAAGRGG